MHESCGIFGVYAPGEDVARLTFFALYALQHRGQESAGIATADGHRIHLHTNMGLVGQVFDEPTLGRLFGDMAIGHNRYSTTGSSHIANAQPISVDSSLGTMALAHNGNLINAEYLRRELKEKGYTFSTSSDTEVIAYLIASSAENTWIDKIRYAMRRMIGAYCLVIMTPNRLFGVRDPLGVRPMSLGQINGHWMMASESCALDHLGVYSVREIEPGEILEISAEGLKSYKEVSEKHAFCVFEYIYFARPDSVIKDRLLYATREAMGAQLAIEHPVDADLVIGVPDSATAAGIGYAYQSGIPVSEGLLKNRYVGRTFIEPDQRIRDLGVKLKFNPLPRIIEGKRLVVIDDSIVRGTTTPHVISMLRRAGAKEVHMRICAPPLRYPCFLGVDMATRGELIAAQKTVEQIAEHIGADSLGYLSVEGLLKAVDIAKSELCLACFTGDYPVPVQLEMDKLALETSDSPSA
jgi:amidophosphoribosyltransferase